METRDTDSTNSSSVDQSKGLDPADGQPGKGDSDKDTKESKTISTSQINEKEKTSSDETSLKDQSATLETEVFKMDTSQQIKEKPEVEPSAESNPEKESISKDTSSETNETGSEEKSRERNISADLKKGEVKIKSGITNEDEDSLVIDEAGDDDTKSESDKAGGSEVRKYINTSFVIKDFGILYSITIKCTS